MNTSSLAFDELLAPTGTDQFVGEYFERRPLLVERDDRSFYGSVFSFSAVDQYLHAARGTSQRVTVVPPVGSDRESRRLTARDVALADLYAAFDAGDTIRLESVQEAWPPVAELVAEFSGVLGVRANVNAYMTPADSQGLPVHFDTHDVFVLQVAGSKEWWWYEDAVELPVERDSYLRHLGRNGSDEVREDGDRLLDNVILETGDMLYVPRGFPHKARTGPGGPSLHLAVAVNPTLWIDALKMAIERAAIEEPALRRTLPLHTAAGAEGRRELADRFPELLESAVSQASFDRALELLEAKPAERPGFPPDGHFAELASVDELTSDSVVERRAGMECRVRSGPEAAVIDFAGQRVQGPKTVGPALRHVRDHRRFRVSELPGELGDGGKLVLVRRLIREGLLRRRSAAGAEEPESAADAVVAGIAGR